VVVLQRRRALIGALVVLGAAAATGCSTAVTSGSASEGASAAATATTESPTTTSPTTTLPPTTTAAPTTTLPPTTTVAPTTLPPTTTLPPNLIPVPVVDPPLQAGETTRIQQRLLELGFWLQAADGNNGLTTKQAVMAFQKYAGLDADGRIGQATADALTVQTMRPVARANSGTLIEVDKTKQLLFFVVDGKTEWILNTSTGNGKEYTEADKNTPGEFITGVSITPDGLHHVNRERPDGWWEGDLGQIYRPKYFVGGVAVHGSNSIPNYPASHGCVRVSVPAMDWIWDSGIMPMKTPVWVHGGA